MPALLKKGGFASAAPERGRFRSYLLGAIKHFLANEWHRTRAEKRGGRIRFIEWDALDLETRYSCTPNPQGNPEHIFDREWALETVARSTARVASRDGRSR